MPPVFHLDNYHMCLGDPEGVYCTAKLSLVSDSSNELLNMIRDYSEHRVKHYNHSELLYGICVTESCREHYNDQQKDRDLKKVLEECLNGTLLKKYELQARVVDMQACITSNDQSKFRKLDYVVAAICCTLIMLNVIGTLYDTTYIEGKEIKGTDKGKKILMMFSIKRNWQKLVYPVDETDPKLECLRTFNGLRTISTGLVISTHTLLPFVSAASNTREVEAIYDNLLSYIFINGTPIVQAFFILSGFLLAYNTQISAEKTKITWRMVPTKIWQRWLRLTPPYALVLAVTSTLLRIAGSGPLWHDFVIFEVEHCRRYGWQNLLFINNYFDDSKCMGATWYLAADMQLYCLGVMVCVLFKTNTAKKYVLSLLFGIGVIIPGVVTYMMDLDGVTIVSPELVRSTFASDPTFHYIYRRGHTNIPSYVLGLSLGFIAYYVMEAKFDVQKYKKYFWTYHLLFPIALTITLMGSIFYRDAPRASVYFRAVYGTFMKTLFTLALALFIARHIFKVDKDNRSFLEWRFWTITARLTYCAYILHVMILRTYFGSIDTLLTVNLTHMVHSCMSVVITCFLLAMPYWLMVEAPLSELCNHLFTPTPAPQEKDKKINKKD